MKFVRSLGSLAALSLLSLVAGCSREPATQPTDALGGDIQAIDQQVGTGRTTETAFGYSCDANLCFTEIDQNNDGRPDFSRWGWTNGPLSEGHYVFDLYAGAGQCNLDAGTLVGQVHVEYHAGTATVEYVTCGRYELTEVHTFVGSTLLPTDRRGRFTVAPGQFPYNAGTLPAGTQSHTATFTNLSGPIYVVAHSVVSGIYGDGDCGERGCVSPCEPSFNPEVLDQALPLGLVSFQVQFQGNVPLFGVDDSMFKGKVTGAGLFDSPEGTFSYSSWCVDLQHNIDSRPAQVTLVSSLNPNATLLACLVDNPENLDLMNWVLNQDPSIWGADQRDVEAALWALLDDTFTFCAGDICNKGGLTYRKAVTQQILADAAANGEGYLPPCDGIIGVFADPGCSIDGTLERQVVIIEVPVSDVEGLCTDCE